MSLFKLAPIGSASVFLYTLSVTRDMSGFCSTRSVRFLPEGSHAAFFFTPSWEASCWPTYNGPYQSRRLRHAAHGQHAIKDLRRAIREILWRNPLERGLPGEGEPVRHFADVATATGARLA